MPRKHRNEGDESSEDELSQLPVVGRMADLTKPDCRTTETAVTISEAPPTKRSRCDISPPPLRRKRRQVLDPAFPQEHCKQNDASTLLPTIAHEQARKDEPPEEPTMAREMDHVYHSDRKRSIYMNVSEEQRILMMNDNPHMFTTCGVKPTPGTKELDAQISKIVHEASKMIETDAASFIAVEYIDSDPRCGIQDTGSKTELSRRGNDSLCSCCQKMVKESQVINRPWRKIVKAWDKGIVRIQEEATVDYHGPKVNVFTHYGKLGALRRSARAGCHLCLLLDAFDPERPIYYNGASTIPYVVKVIYAKDHNEGPGVLVLEPSGRPTKATHLMFDESRRKIAGTLTETRTDAEPVLALARRWLHTCMDSHEACRARSAESKGFIPTRLIRVKQDEGSVQSISLALGRDLTPDTMFLALSHCWGGANMVKLSKSTLHAFQKDIPLNLLPKNFIDAMTITVLLGYSYIWVDSLCIIQDCAEDWKEEAAKMGSVYRNSVCTIAALGARNSQGGCFVNRSSLAFIPCQLLPKTANRPGVYAENWHALPEPLHTRAWVVQERCLSVRTLNFGADQLSWDCIAVEASEEDPEMKDTSYYTSLKHTLHNLLNRSAARHDTQGEDWLSAWWKLVEEYSSCDLTYKSDKWPAIKGLATEVEHNRGQRLVHGLWEDNLADELLWTISVPKNIRLDIGVPSWSWLSINGRVHRRRYKYHMDFKLDAMTNFVIPPTMYLPPSGSQSDTLGNEIEIEGCMLRLIWVLRTSDGCEESSYHFRLQDKRRRVLDKKWDVWDGQWIPDTTPDRSWETWALQIVTSDDEEQLKTRAGLVVVPVDEKGQIWKRVGFYEFKWRDETHCDESMPKRWFGHRRHVTLI